ncbi:uncharacterized protein BJX67DRAFT_224951 [Aspergillus lucknowensis]|uniref:Uncharacterized protein n=1 Tax=Aspergillus lucknowensis TaxID=176173 RepID=A0ABR4LI64_9EURO
MLLIELAPSRIFFCSSPGQAARGGGEPATSRPHLSSFALSIFLVFPFACGLLRLARSDPSARNAVAPSGVDSQRGRDQQESLTRGSQYRASSHCQGAWALCFGEGTSPNVVHGEGGFPMRKGFFFFVHLISSAPVGEWEGTSCLSKRLFSSAQRHQPPGNQGGSSNVRTWRTILSIPPDGRRKFLHGGFVCPSRRWPSCLVTPSPKKLFDNRGLHGGRSIITAQSSLRSTVSYHVRLFLKRQCISRLWEQQDVPRLSSKAGVRHLRGSSAVRTSPSPPPAWSSRHALLGFSGGSRIYDCPARG